MNKLLLASAIALAVAGCSKNEDHDAHVDHSAHSAEEHAAHMHAEGEKHEHNDNDVVKIAKSGIDLTAMDTSVKPGDDFDKYVNGTWQANMEMPADKSRYGVFNVLRDESQDAVKVIIEEAANGDHAKGSDAQKVGDLYNSYLDWDTRNAAGLEPIKPALKAIASIETLDDMAAFLGANAMFSLDAPLGVSQYADLKNPKAYTMYAGQGGLGLPDREYYLKDDEKSAETRDKYVAHVAKMFELAGIENSADNAATVMAVETAIANIHMTKEENRNYAENYNKVSTAELDAMIPSFNWVAYLDNAGLSNVGEYVSFNTPYFEKLDAVLTETSIDDWKTYLTWKLIDSSASSLTEDLDKQNFEFFGKVLRGTQEQQPHWRRGVSLVGGSIGEIVGKVYVAKHFPPEAKERMDGLVQNLIKAYEVSIKDLDWMGEETKVQALDKLSKFTPMIGYPDEWRDYSAIEIDGDNLVGNLHNIQMANWQRDLDRQNSPVDTKEWGMTPQTVNAYYNPPLNQIVFPAAILQAPFFDLAADDAVNYGAIGGVIGHEIGHGFDDKGSTFDGDGVLRNWWTDEDRAEFEKRTGALVEQFNGYFPFEGEELHVNGEFTLGENIGDLGGLSIALKAYKMSLNGEEAPVIDGFTGEQRVFLGWAQVWRGKIRDEALRTQIATDPHSPAKYRINGIVRNIPQFYEAFDVQEGDALYLAPEDRVKIW